MADAYNIRRTPRDQIVMGGTREDEVAKLRRRFQFSYGISTNWPVVGF